MENADRFKDESIYDLFESIESEEYKAVAGIPLNEANYAFWEDLRADAELGNDERAKGFITEIDGFGFNCIAGPLTLNLRWTEIKRRINQPKHSTYYTHGHLPDMD